MISSAVPSGSVRRREPRAGVRGRGRAARAGRRPSGAGRRAGRSRRAARPRGRSAAPAGPVRAGRAGRSCPAATCSRSVCARTSWLARSTPAIGSSMISSSGSAARARAISTRWCWPPESAFTESLARSAMPTRSRARRTASRSALRSTPKRARDSRPEDDDLGHRGRARRPRRSCAAVRSRRAPSRGTGAAGCRTARSRRR